MTTNIILIIACVSLGSMGQILQKAGVNTVNSSHVVEGASIGVKIFHFLFNPLVILGLSCYAVAAVLWIFLLSRVPVSWAYPFLGLTYFLVMFLSVIFLHEKITTLQILGTSFIWLGVFLLFRVPV